MGGRFVRCRWRRTHAPMGRMGRTACAAKRDHKASCPPLTAILRGPAKAPERRPRLPQKHRRHRPHPPQQRGACDASVERASAPWCASLCGAGAVPHTCPWGMQTQPRCLRTSRTSRCTPGTATGADLRGRIDDRPMASSEQAASLKQKGSADETMRGVTVDGCSSGRSVEHQVRACDANTSA